MIKHTAVDIRHGQRSAGPSRTARMLQPVAFSQPAVAILDVPQLLPEVPAHHPLIAAYTVPWPGANSVSSSSARTGAIPMPMPTMTTSGAVRAASVKMP